jgi:hypothetical protein
VAEIFSCIAAEVIRLSEECVDVCPSQMMGMSRCAIIWLRLIFFQGLE